jgi:hypothetical protein
MGFITLACIALPLPPCSPLLRAQQGADVFTAKLDIEVSAASQSAIAAVEAAGGSIRSVYYTPLALRALLQPHKFELPLKSPAPPANKIAYYLDAKNRGYLSREVQLAEVKRRAAAGVPHPTAVMPLYVPGAKADRGLELALPPAQAATKQ